MSQPKCVPLLLTVVMGLLLTIGCLNSLAKEDDKKEEVILKQGARVRLKKDGKELFTLVTSREAEKIALEGNWAKVKFTGWVLKSNISGPEQEEEEKTDKTKQAAGDKIKSKIKGKAGPFLITIQDIHFEDKVEDRFGTVYESGSNSSFLIVDLVAQNTNDQQEMNLYKTNIALIDEEGRQYKSVGISNNESFKGGSIKPEERKEGYLFFSIFDDYALNSIQFNGRPCSSCTKYEESYKLLD